jgi:hypothetical protein
MDPKRFEGLPVAGYVPQNAAAIDLVNLNKEAEERVLRVIDLLMDGKMEVDKRWLAIARTDLQKGFMALNRAIFQPRRISLPDDPPLMPPAGTGGWPTDGGGAA